MQNLFSFSLSFCPAHLFIFLFHPAAQKPFPAAHFPCAGPFSLPAQPVSLPFPPSLTDAWGPSVGSFSYPVHEPDSRVRTPRAARPDSAWPARQGPAPAYKSSTPRPPGNPKPQSSLRPRKTLDAAAAIVELRPSSNSAATPPFRHASAVFEPSRSSAPR